jgi:hypothetical protein
VSAPLFYLGTHRPSWLERTDAPLFISRRTLTAKKLPRAHGRWALDSGGFTELNLNGAWTVSPAEYVADVRRFRDEIGGLDWAAPQDWMCEPFVTAKTGLSVAEHQRRTVENYLELRSLEPGLPIIPVLQGWQPCDYLDCIEAYTRAGVDLGSLPTVGLGSVCRRQGTAGAMRVVHTVVTAVPGIRLHGFGFKTRGLMLLGHHFVSADSLAWSYQARRAPPLPDCEGHINCANCIVYALDWRERLVDRLAAELDGAQQLEMAVAA